MSDDDPLADAAPGETVTLNYTKTADPQPIGHVLRSDADSRMEVVDIEVVGTQHDSDAGDLQVQYRETLTKQVPMHLHDRPFDLARYRRRKRAERRAERVPDIPGWFKDFAPSALIIGLSSLGAAYLTPRLFANVTINGERLGPITPMEMLPSLALIMTISAVLMWLMNTRVPRVEVAVDE